MSGDFSRWAFDYLLPRWLQREIYFTRTPRGCVDWSSVDAFHMWSREHNRWWRRLIRWML